MVLGSVFHLGANSGFGDERNQKGLVLRGTQSHELSVSLGSSLLQLNAKGAELKVNENLAIGLNDQGITLNANSIGLHSNDVKVGPP